MAERVAVLDAISGVTWIGASQGTQRVQLARPCETRAGDALLALLYVSLKRGICLVVGLEGTTALIASNGEVPEAVAVLVDSFVHPRFPEPAHLKALVVAVRAAPFHHVPSPILYAECNDFCHYG